MTAVNAFYDKERGYPPPEPRKSFRQRANMRALVEVAKTFHSLGVPVILLSGMLLGWRRGCMAVPGDMDVDLGTFGPWLAAVGMDRLRETFGAAGHHLETDLCQHGLLEAGCELRVTLSGVLPEEQELAGVPYVDIEVLFSAPPVSVGRMPGRFDKCKEDVCGRKCELCSFAYGLWSGSLRDQGRFFACPIPVGKFELVAWMNQTFWAPAALEGYLESEYGETWPIPAAHLEKWPTYRPCQPYMDADVSFSPYASFIPGLKSAADILKEQDEAQVQQAEKIHQAAERELQFWGAAMIATKGPPWQPRVEELQEHAAQRREAAAIEPWRRVRVLLAAVTAVATVAACALTGWRCAAGGGTGCAWLLTSLEAKLLSHH